MNGVRSKYFTGGLRLKLYRRASPEDSSLGEIADHANLYSEQINSPGSMPRKA